MIPWSRSDATDTTSVQPLLDALDEEQRSVATYAGPPLLVVAGPGSGKTRVLTHRFALSVAAADIPRQRILAVTFTRAAAREMERRVDSLLGHNGRLHIGTFHRIGQAILDHHASVVGYRSRPQVLAPRDSADLLFRVTGNETGGGIPNTRLVAALRAWKSGLSIDEVGHKYQVEPAVMRDVAHRYRDSLRRRNAVDVDDLVWLSVQILNRSPAAHRCERCRHDEILVDEYQDVNPVQRDLLQMLLPEGRRMVAVGDDDQAIYGWRHAVPESVGSFRDRFPDGTVMTLTRNYRSTKHIVRAGNALVRHNTRRHDRLMITRNAAGPRPVVVGAGDARAEADRISEQLARLQSAEGVEWSDCAILFRTNAQSREIEEALLRHGFPYTAGQRLRFYERPEIMHAVAYMRLALDASDDEAAGTLLSSLHGMGPVGIARLHAALGGAPGALARALVSPSEAEAVWRDRVPAAARLADHLASVLASRTGSIPTLVDTIVSVTAADLRLATDSDVGDSGFLTDLQTLAHDGHRNRQTLRSLVARLQPTAGPAGDAGGVALLSLHAAKGLEFAIVVIAGLEEGTLPHLHAQTESEIEEERRLCYVGMTRAASRLFLTHARERDVAGERRRAVPSRFLAEIGSVNLRREDSRAVRSER